MAFVSAKALDMIEAGFAAPTARKIGDAFFKALRPYGVRAAWARSIESPGALLPARTYMRLSPPCWESLYSEQRFDKVNYLNRALPHRDEPFAWSSIPLVSADEQALARTLIDLEMPDGLAIPCHGANGQIGVTSLAFERLHQVDPADRNAIEIAALVLYQRMRRLAGDKDKAGPSLSPRERDCIAFIADGHSDADIADRLGISETTVITHVQNARRKLGARTRAQAVARAFLHRLI